MNLFAMSQMVAIFQPDCPQSCSGEDLFLVPWEVALFHAISLFPLIAKVIKAYTSSMYIYSDSIVKVEANFVCASSQDEKGCGPSSAT